MKAVTIAKKDNLNIELVKRGNIYMVLFDGWTSRIRWEIPAKNFDLILFNKDSISSARELHYYATV